MAIDINRGTTGVTLPATVSSQIWAKTLPASAVMSATPMIPLPGNGLTVPTITGEAVANWVDETENKPVSRPTVGSKSLRGYTLAVIVPFSNQFRRDASTLYNELVRRLPAALARKFDRTVFGLDAAPGSEFSQLNGADDIAVDSTNTLADLAAVYTAITDGTAGNDLTDWLVTPGLFATLFTATDALGRQLFVPGGPSTDQVGSILGAPVTKVPGAPFATDVTGIAGDFKNQAAWGQVEGVNVAISDQATLTDGATTINLWQRNMFAVRAEMEVGFIVKDLTAFRQIKTTVV